MKFKNQIRFKLMIIVAMVLLLFGTTVYFVSEINRLNRLNLERNLISTKVTLIMKLFNCDNREIHEAILETFDPVLVAIVIGVESEFRVNAMSPAGCRGLMQLTPDKLDDWKNIKKNITIGSTYLEEQIKRFGSLELAIAAYNAGPEAVSKYKGIPPYRETKKYVEKTKQLSLAFDHLVPWNLNRDIIN